MTSALVLGTAQLGSDYGIVNFRGKVPAAEVAEILDLARGAGIDRIDTAPAYGDAEQVLHSCGIEDFKIITKVPKLKRDGDADLSSALVDAARRSCQSLGCQRLHGLLLHSADDLTGRDGSEIHAGLLAARDAGLVEQIGVSVYTADEIETVLDRYSVDIIQLPLSVLDQRLRALLPRLADRGVSAHVRSIFLQGLLLCPVDKVPQGVAQLGPAIEAFRQRAARAGMQVVEAAVAFVRDLPHVDGIVVGTASVNEFRALLDAFATKSSFDADGLAVARPDLIDPRSWAVA